MFSRQLFAFTVSALFGSVAHAQTFAFHVSQSQSSMQIDSSLSQAMPGTVIGNYDATTNPTGTLTLPGLFGGSGNVAVPMSITLQTELAFQGPPTGSFDAQFDVNLGTLSIQNFALDALGGQVAQANLTLELLYQSFRTFQPNSLFLGGIPLPLPFGQASVSGLTFVQNGPASGVLFPDPVLPNTYAVSALIPADVTFTVDLLGQVTPVGPLPVALPLTGTLAINGANAQLTLSAKQNAGQTIPDPFPGQTIDNIPLPVPTILPPGATANLLFNAIFGELGFDLASSFDIVADGAGVCAAPTRYCGLSPNSVGSGAVIDTVGVPSVSANKFWLRTSNLPVHRVTLVVFGNQQQTLPFGAGTLCVGGQVYRLTVWYSNPFGVIDSQVDFSIPSPKYQALIPGSTWNFQTIYRDPLFSNPAGNTSDAVQVVICP